MIVRDYGFVSYLIMLGYKYEVNNGAVNVDIDKDEFSVHSKIYKRNYSHKDKILRSLLKELKT